MSADEAEPDVCAQCNTPVDTLTPESRTPWAEEGVCAPCLAMDLEAMAEDARAQGQAIAAVAQRYADVLPAATVRECLLLAPTVAFNLPDDMEVQGLQIRDTSRRGSLSIWQDSVMSRDWIAKESRHFLPAGAARTLPELLEKALPALRIDIRARERGNT